MQERADEMARRAEPKWVANENRWRLTVYRNGQRKVFHSRDPSIKGKRDVEKRADVWLNTGESGDIRFGELWKKYLERCKATTGKSNYTQHEVIGRLYLLPRLDFRFMTKITPLQWQECIDLAYAKGLSKKYLYNIKASIAAAHKFATLLMIPIEMPAISIPTNAPVKDKTVLQPEQLDILFEHDSYTKSGRTYEVFYINAFRFAVLTGMRRGELCGLRKEDISGEIVNVRRAVNRFLDQTKGKNDNAVRSFHLFEYVHEVLKRQQALLEAKGIDSPWVFPNTLGKRTNPSTFFRHWERYRDAFGITSSIHELRHTAISVSGFFVPENLLKSVVGHSSKMDTFGVYGHEIEGDKKQTASLMQSAFARFIKDPDSQKT